MKIKNITLNTQYETWYGNKGKIKHKFTQIFALITGYEFLFEESRKDIRHK
jgi:hypothetical protein